MDKHEFFYEVTTRICGSLHIEAAMHHTLRYLEQYMPVDEMYFALFDYDASIYRVIARATKQDGLLINKRYKLTAEAITAVRRFDNTKPLIINTTNEDALISQLYPEHDHFNRSALVLPLKLDGRLVGVAQLFAGGTAQYTEKHAAMLSHVIKPFSLALSNCLEHLELEKHNQELGRENKRLRKLIQSSDSVEIIGRNHGLKKVFEMTQLVAPLNSPVLITGETGTGKEVIADTIHYSSMRKDGPFIKVNCGAIAPTLLDSELFGHEKGAFTGALAQKKGRFERAHNGTIFLDEVGELTPEAQTRLLRVLQEREIERVGGTETVPVDIRLICATNRDLQTMVAQGAFREDLMFRINVFPIPIPPLRSRKEDIPLLADHFLRKICTEMGRRHIPKITEEDMRRLQAYEWPGNVRELQNAVERSIILSKGENLDITQSIPEPALFHLTAAADEEQYLDTLMKQHILDALDQSGGKVSGPKGAAAILNINPSTLHNRMKKLGIR